MTFHESIFLNIKLEPTTTSSPRKRGRGLQNPDSSHDQIQCFWLAEVRNFTNIMIELSPIRPQPITWTNAHLFSIWPVGANFSEIVIEIQNFVFTKMHLKTSSVKWRPLSPKRRWVKSNIAKIGAIYRQGFDMTYEELWLIFYSCI